MGELVVLVFMCFLCVYCSATCGRNQVTVDGTCYDKVGVGDMCLESEQCPPRALCKQVYRASACQCVKGTNFQTNPVSCK
uniref:EB domain-containing protein n=1 Tax=Romanomermis culicivorax TaxID=13658 RepID=A0A915I6E6_ROMCU